MFLVALAALTAAPDIIFLSVDTLRADRLGVYGCPRDTSPSLDRLGEQSLVFEDCVCEVPLTMPSFSSMLSSQYPRNTGTTRNGLSMPKTVPLVAEQFRAAGYQTLCVQSNWTLKAHLSRLDRGFDVYEDRFHNKRWGVIKPERFAGEVTDVALKLLSERDRTRPLFMWIHYSDPHAPYRFHREHNPAGRQFWGLSRKEKARAKYDSEVAYCDFHIGRLLDALPENCCLLFVADHGESLHEHGYLGHGRRLYQHEMHIPLMVRSPGLAPGRTTAPVRGIDVGPTLLGLAGLPAPESMLGLDILHAEVPDTRVRVFETYGGAVPKLPGARALMAGQPPLMQGVIAGEWKLIFESGRTHLYCLPKDPGEEDDVYSGNTALAEKLRGWITAWDAKTDRKREVDNPLSEEDLEALEGLGYLAD